MEHKKRNLDVTTTSMDKIALNNLIVSMRHLVQRCKVRVINKLVRQIKKYRNRRGPELKVNKCKRKADRIVGDIQVVKKLDKDKTAQHCLSNTATVKEAETWPAELKAMTRVACDKAMQEYVLKWRSEHEDWKSLAAFLKERVTRRLKKKKMKMEEEENEEEEGDSNEGETPKNTIETDKDSKAVSGETSSDVVSPSPQENMDIDDGDSGPGEESSDTEEKDVDLKDSNHGEELQKSKPVVHPSRPRSKHMVVKKVNLTDATGDADDLIMEDEEEVANVEEKDVSFLFGDSDKSEKETVKEKKAKSSFFVVSEDEDGESSVSGNEESKVSSSSGEEEEERETVRKKSASYVNESTFVGQLSVKQGAFSKQQKNREPYRATRPQRGQSHPQRGRGHSHLQRGRGHSRPERGRDYSQPQRGRGHSQSRGSQLHGRTDRQRRRSERQILWQNRNMPEFQQKQQWTDRPQGRFEKDTRRRFDNKGSTFDNKGSTEGVQKGDLETEKGNKLHPSWEASKKKKMESQIVTFSGKKITFDD